MPDNTAASVTGRGEELERALQEGRRWAEEHKRPEGGQELVDWQAGYAPYRQATREAHEKAPVSALAMATAGDWRRAFKEAEAAPNALGAALALAKRGALIFPCNPEHKGPHDILGRTGGCFWATDNPVEIEAWWTAAPLACIGLLLGRRTGVWAIDIDTGKAHNGVDGIGNLNRLEDDIGARISGRIHKTANDGRHMLFKWYDGGPQGKRNPFKIGDVAYEGVEIIGDGAFIIVPPSKLLNGLQYTVGDESIPPAPHKKLVAVLKGGKGKEEKVKKIREQPEPAADAKWDPTWCADRLRDAVEALRATGPGTYDLYASVALKIGSIVAGHGLDDATAWAALAEAATTGKPNDYLAKVARAYAKGKENPWVPQQQFVKWPDWYGKPLNTLTNTVMALGMLDEQFYYDKCSYRNMIVEPHAKSIISDVVMGRLRLKIRDRFGFEPGKDVIFDAILHCCADNAFHPFEVWLNSLPWDKTSRVDNLLHVYFGAEDTELNRVLSRIMMIAAVRRIRHPGCEFQIFIVLQGPQGKGKSKALKVLAGLEYFSDQNILAVHSPQKQMEMMEGVVIYELAELQGITDRTIEAVKAFASRQVDQDRMVWYRFKDYRPRQCIFIGTVNDLHFLHDRTGNRRFGPVAVGEIDLKALERDRVQLWAEAAVREANEESIEVPEALWGVAAAEQDKRLVTDPWDDALVDIETKGASYIQWVNAQGENLRIRSRDIMSASELLNIPLERQTQALSKRLGHVMRKLGWKGPKLLWFPNEKVQDKGFTKSGDEPSEKPPVPGDVVPF
jgi:Virulence-associated protein E-like domain/Bifunctional DNA primase/polymerase, N-terminal